MARSLNVVWGTRLVGEFQQTDTGQLRFAYSPEWLRSADAVPLSQSLPLRPEPFAHKASRPFFAGLLPEEAKRELVARELQVTAKNDFALLDRIGGDCAGAIAFLPPGVIPPEFTSAADYRPLPDAELAGILRRLPDKPLLAGEQGIRLSLAGAQDKLPVLYADGKIALPLGTAPSSHILKPRIRQFPDTVVNEAFCMTLAKHLGLQVAEVEIREAESERFLLVERYDRFRTENGQLLRLHQEDFCQALGIPPEWKYQNEGGPSLVQCFALVRAASSRPTNDLARLLDYVIYNFLVGNTDAHGKNFSLLYHPDNRLELAPMYDVVSTLPYPDIAPKLAMKIGGKYEPEVIFPRHWERLAQEVGLAKPLARRRIVEMTSAIKIPFDYTKQLVRPYSPAFVDSLTDLIAERVEVVRERFTQAVLSGKAE